MDPRQGKKLFIVTCTGYFTFGLLNASLGPLLEQFAANNQVTLATVGSIYTALFMGGLLAQMVFGPFSDRWGQQRCLAVSFLVLAVFLTAATFSRFYPLTVALMFIAGMGYGLAVLSGNTLVARLFEENSVSALNWINVFFGIGDVVGPLLVSLAFLLLKNGLPVLWLGAAGMLAVTLMLIVRYFKVNIGGAGTAAQAHNERLKFTPFLLSLAAMILAYVGSEAAMGSWTTTYMQRTTSMAIEGAALVTASFWLALTLGRLMGALLGSRISAENLLKLCLGISLAGAMLFMFGFENEILSIAAVMILGFGFGAVFPTVFGIMSTAYGKNSGKPGSLLTSMASVSGMLLPWLIGVVFEKTGMRSMTFMLAGLITLLCITFFINLQTRMKSAN
jgi:fucose permease